MEMRFHYQTHEIEVPVPDGALTDASLDAVMRKFEQLYEQSYGKGTGYRKAGIEVSTFRLTATLAMPKPALVRQPLAGEDAAAAKKGERPVVFDRRSRFIATAIYDAERLRPGNRIAGPAVVESPATTTIVHPGQRVRVDEYLNLILEFA
jgi:N-methylhydantoinase A